MNNIAARSREERAATYCTRFQSILDQLIKDFGNIAAVAALKAGDAEPICFSSGFEDRPGTNRATDRHLYQIGSQSKMIVALTTVALARSGKIELDTPVTSYIDLPISPEITPRHLIMNSSGLGEFTYGIPPHRFDPRLAMSPRDIVALALPQGQRFKPGSRFDYSNTGWVIAAMIIEQVCGRPYGQLIDELIVHPLGLQQTAFGGRRPEGAMLRGYMKTDATGDFIDTSGCLGWAYGAGDGISSLRDMLVIFGSLVDEDSPLGITLSDLNRETGKPDAKPIFVKSLGAEYGLGIERRAWAGQEVWGHAGSTYSYQTGTWVDPENDVIVTTCVTSAVELPFPPGFDLRYSPQQLFSMALATAYALAES